MKKYGILFVLSLLIITGCSNILDYSVKYIDIDSTDTKVKKWVEDNKKTDGIYIGKSDEDKNYYLYVNYSYKEVTIKSREKDSLIIDVKTRKSVEKGRVIFCITIGNKSFKKFILNDEEINTSEVSIIK